MRTLTVIQLKIDGEPEENGNWLTVLKCGTALPSLHRGDCRFVQAFRQSPNDALLLQSARRVDDGFNCDSPLNLDFRASSENGGFGMYWHFGNDTPSTSGRYPFSPLVLVVIGGRKRDPRERGPRPILEHGN